MGKIFFLGWLFFLMFTVLIYTQNQDNFPALVYAQNQDNFPTLVYAQNQDNIQNLETESTVSGRNRLQLLDSAKPIDSLADIGYKEKAELLIPRLSALKSRIENISQRLSSRYEKEQLNARGSGDFSNQLGEITKLTSALPEQETKTLAAKKVFLESSDPIIAYSQFRDQVMFYYLLEKQILDMQSTFIKQLNNSTRQ